MDTQTIETQDTEASNGVFRVALDTMPTPLFAVLDGGHFDDLEDELADADIASRSLFLKGGNDEMRRDGPWLVTLKNRSIREHIEELALEKPCAVFWSCQAGEDALWRHLRGINQVLVPDDRILQNGRPAGKPIVYERVLFRHWDPNVLGSFLPLFSMEQFARIFGPATAILANVTNNGRFKRALRPPNLPEAPGGLLKIEPAQIEIVSQAKISTMVGRVSEYLSSVAGEKCREFSNNELTAFAYGSVRESIDLGVTSEGSHCRWAYLKLLSGGRVSTSPQVMRAMRADDTDISPNDRVKILMQKIMQEVKGG
ncbi:hypothetical protein FHX14_005918 [Rhizobium sp. BK619]|uniref:DUF4123 domain-containing protein n=1 Tax=Rhizobium sp. BK619 TaxID=2586989 RepID=UPI00160C6532|nr:DUF4123 domain-containing protein [Rhizobium sp. BK619]MBB3649677.1 hypothetical protein [Rhizobium sp. BK619]